jgi:hypothetical protein
MANLFNSAASLTNYRNLECEPLHDIIFTNAGLGITSMITFLMVGLFRDSKWGGFSAGASEFVFWNWIQNDFLENTFAWTITDGGENCTDVFTTTWQTDNPGASGDKILYLLMAQGIHVIDWGDGSGTMNVLVYPYLCFGRNVYS